MDPASIVVAACVEGDVACLPVVELLTVTLVRRQRPGERTRALERPHLRLPIGVPFSLIHSHEELSPPDSTFCRRKACSKVVCGHFLRRSVILSLCLSRRMAMRWT